MRSKIWAVLSLVLILSLALAACQQTPAPTGAAPSNDNGAVSQPVDQPVSLTLWHAYQTGSAEEATLAKLIQNAKTEFPNMTISVLQIPFDQIFNKYQQEVAAGGGPDLYVAPNDDLGNWARGEFIMPLDSYLAGKLGNISEVAVEGMKVDGVLYGVPESAKAVALYYNKALVPNPPTTTDELLQMVKDGTSLNLFVGAYHMFGFSGAFGGELLDADSRCVADQGGWAEAMQYILDLKNAGATVTGDYATAEGPFRAGEVGMFVNGPWALADYKADLGENLGVVPIPTGPGGPSNPLNGIDGFYINPNSDNPEAAIDLALFLTNAASSAIYTAEAGHVPIRSDVTADDDLIAAFAQASATGYPRPQSVEFGNFWGPFGDAWTKVVEGALTPAEAITEACTAMNAASGK